MRRPVSGDRLWRRGRNRFKVSSWTARNLWAWRTDLKRLYIFSRFRVGLCDPRNVSNTLRQWPLEFRNGFFSCLWWIDPDGGRELRRFWQLPQIGLHLRRFLFPARIVSEVLTVDFRHVQGGNPEYLSVQCSIAKCVWIPCCTLVPKPDVKLLRVLAVPLLFKSLTTCVDIPDVQQSPPT